MAMRWQLCVCSLGILLLVPCALAEKFSLSGSPRPVMGVVGQDVVLPCQLSPPDRLLSMGVLWRKIDTGFIPVHEYLDEGPTEQAGEGYQNRTELFRQEFSSGNVSLKLKRLRVADDGKYHCFVRDPEWSREAITELQVAAVAPVFIDVLGPRGQGIGLACRSAGWFPKPELQWTGKNQQNLAMETVTDVTEDEDNLYSVVSHITVTEEDSGDISCIVQNGLLEPERQSAIHISSDVFPRVSPWLAAFWALFALVLIAAVACAYLAYTAKRKASKKKCAEEEAMLSLENQEQRKSLDAQGDAFQSELKQPSQKIETENNETESPKSENQEQRKSLAQKTVINTLDRKMKSEGLDAQGGAFQSELKQPSQKIETENNETESPKSESQEPPEGLETAQIEEDPLQSESPNLQEGQESEEMQNDQKSESPNLQEGQESEEMQNDSKPDMAPPELDFKHYMVSVTLDPECKHPDLAVSEDGKTVWHEPPSTKPVDPSKPLIAVGREGFVTRQANGMQGRICRWYWEVEVGDSPDWALGVLSETMKGRTKHEWLPKVPEQGCWALRRSGGQYRPNEADTVIQSWAEKPTVVGVFLDLEERRLSFYSVSSMTLILKIPVEDSESLFPFLSPGHTAGKPLSICPFPPSQ